MNSRNPMTPLPLAFSFVDLAHWHRVTAERARQGLKQQTEEGPLASHPLLGKTLVDRTTGKEYLVERVSKEWWCGWYLTALLNTAGTPRVCHIKNMSCTDSGILQSIESFDSDFGQPE